MNDKLEKLKAKIKAQREALPKRKTWTQLMAEVGTK
jgi:hypothetical protein